MVVLHLCMFRYENNTEGTPILPITLTVILYMVKCLFYFILNGISVLFHYQMLLGPKQDHPTILFTFIVIIVGFYLFVYFLEC